MNYPDMFPEMTPSVQTEITPCVHCHSTEGKIVPSGNMHAARIDCRNCGRFHGWLSKAKYEEMNLAEIFK